MTTIVYTARNGLKLLGTEVGAWMDTTDATTDHTENLKDLTENGTLTKSVVNTNAPSMQYSGFSATNYLERAYDSDFDLLGDPATDGHTLMAWVNVGTVTDAETIIDRQDTGGTGARYNLRLNADGTTKVTVSDGTNTRAVDSTTDLNNTGWNFIVATWDSAGTQNIYINGVLDTTDALGTSVGSLVNGTAVFRIGLSATGADPCAQGLTMCKVLPYNITALNVASIYKSEQSLFAEYATYAIYGNATTFTFPTQRLNRTANQVGSISNSIGGNRQVMHDREDVTYDVMSSETRDGDALSFQVMLSAVMQGDTLTFDPYDVSNAVSVYCVSQSYTASRIETTDYFTFSFKVREV